MKRIVIIGAVGVVAILAALFLSQYSDREDGTETATQAATADGESTGAAEPSVEGAAPEPGAGARGNARAGGPQPPLPS